MATRTAASQLTHDTAVALIANSRFKTFSTTPHINPDGELNQPAGGAPPLYPDIVVIERGPSDEDRDILSIIVEVETAESVTADEADHEWVSFSNLAIPFYLCVPEGSEQIAKVLCEERKIGLSGLWSYSLSVMTKAYPLVP